jgi:hypothetical protein
MTLMDVARQLDSLNDDDVITCADEGHWNPQSAAGLLRVKRFDLPGQDRSIPNYFLEVFIAKEVLVVWRAWRGGREPSIADKCEALIYYAKNDAYIPLEERP